MLGGPGACRKFFEKKNGAIWCILGHILAFKTLLSISRCAYASFSQNADLLRAFISISNLLPGIINRPKSRLFS